MIWDSFSLRLVEYEIKSWLRKRKNRNSNVRNTILNKYSNQKKINRTLSSRHQMIISFESVWQEVLKSKTFRSFSRDIPLPVRVSSILRSWRERRRTSVEEVCFSSIVNQVLSREIPLGRGCRGVSGIFTSPGNDK